MNTNSTIRRSEILAMVLLMVGFLSATSHAQTDVPIFRGTFTLSDQVLWGKTVLQPGDYTITIGSSRSPNFVLVRDSKGRAVARLITAIDSGRRTGDENVLLITPKDGQLRVYSLVLGNLGRALIYDPALARQAVLEARAPQTVPITWAER